jgi:hypothetical protein
LIGLEIYQAKCDRALNTTIAIAYIRLTTDQTASAVILTQSPNKPDVFAFRTQAFFWSLGIGAIAMLIALIILRLLGR